MSDGLIAKILDECRSIPNDLPFQIVPLRVNEPFLDKRIFDICRQINETLPNAQIQLFSNGSPLNATNLMKLATIRNLARLVISLHENRPEIYERIVGIPFERTIRNVEKVAFCCIDSDGQWRIGDINRQHLLEIYNRPERRILRERLINRTEVSQCANCSLRA